MIKTIKRISDLPINHEIAIEVLMCHKDSFFIVIAILLILPVSQAAEESCTKRIEAVTFKELNNLILTSSQIECLGNKEKYHCDRLESGLKNEDKNLILKCDRKSLETSKARDAELLSCAWNGIKLSGENLLDLVTIPAAITKAVLKTFRETQACNRDIKQKRELLEAFNSTLSDDRFKLEEKFLGKAFLDLSCAEIEKLLHSRFDNYQQQINREFLAAKNTGRPYLYPEEFMGKNSEIYKALKQIMEEANVSFQCYTPKAKVELACAALSSLVADFATGAGLSKAVIAVKKAAKLSDAVSGAIINGSPTLQLNKASDHLDSINIPYETQKFLGGYEVIRPLPTNSTDTPTWLKMIKSLDEKHNIPTYIDPVLPKKYGFQGASLRIPKSGTSIALDSDFISSNPENVKVLLAHEAVHATGDRRIIAGKVGADNDLKIQFRSDSTLLSPNLPKAYSRFFSVDEVKAYYKQSKILKTVLKKHRNELDPLTIEHVTGNAVGAIRVTDNFSKASLKLLDETEQFLKNNPSLDKSNTYIKQRSEPGSKNVFDVFIKVNQPGKESFLFEIPIRDPEAAKTGKMLGLNQRLIKIIQEAKKTVEYYEKNNN